MLVQTPECMAAHSRHNHQYPPCKGPCLRAFGTLAGEETSAPCTTSECCVIYVKRLGDELLNWTYFSDIACRDEMTSRRMSVWSIQVSLGSHGRHSDPAYCTISPIATSMTVSSTENFDSADSTKSTARDASD
ncbi:hypothetical protein KC355_g51 [Hortaea werneckii]|nr:hypothetical protein KC355_g51 [Hortaea werneckii]